MMSQTVSIRGSRALAKTESVFRSFLRGLFTLPEGAPANEYRFHRVGGYTFVAAFLFHFSFIFLFYVLGVIALSLLNMGSTILWMGILYWHQKGWRRLSVGLALLEINFHSVMCVTYFGWDAGFQYYILTTPLLICFAPAFSRGLKIILTLAAFLVFAGQHYLSKNTAPLHALGPLDVTIMGYASMLAMFFVLFLASFYYNMAANKAEDSLVKEKLKSDEMAALLKKMFGRYLSTEVMNSLIEDPSSLELGGERRTVSIMMTDLRGFTSLSERLEPEQVIQMLNCYFEVMVDTILKYNGTINEIIGDALLVVFGAPQELSDRTERAVACAIDMQNAMSKVNRALGQQGLPKLEMGIGLNETDVIVGNVGSSKRSKYAVVGGGVNMASRIESYSVGGQVLVSESVHKVLGDLLRIDGQRQVLPKGADAPLRIFEVGGIAGAYNLALEAREEGMIRLRRRIPLRWTVLGGKDTGKEELSGQALELSPTGAKIVLDKPVSMLANLRMKLEGVIDGLETRDFYAKVIECAEKENGVYLVRFTAIPPEINSYFQAYLQHASDPE